MNKAVSTQQMEAINERIEQLREEHPWLIDRTLPLPSGSKPLEPEIYEYCQQYGQSYPPERLMGTGGKPVRYKCPKGHIINPNENS